MFYSYDEFVETMDIHPLTKEQIVDTFRTVKQLPLTEATYAFAVKCEQCENIITIIEGQKENYYAVQIKEPEGQVLIQEWDKETTLIQAINDDMTTRIFKRF